MLRFNLFKRTSHQTFKYIPRYYDPEKEALQERLKRYDALAEEGASIDTTKERIRSGLRSRHGGFAEAGYRSRIVRKSNYRLLIIIMILIMLCVLFLQSNQLESVLDSLLN